MSPGVATKVIGASCALTAFAVAIASGLFAGNPIDTILARAIGALVVGSLVGMAVGTIGERTVFEAIRKYEQDRASAKAKIAPPGAGVS